MCAESAPPRRPARGQRRRAARGLSLVELMIGLVIGLLVSMAALSSLRIFGNGQRQGAVAGGSLLGATAALGAIRNDVAAAGLGFFDGRLPLCNRLNLSVGAGALMNGDAFSPLRVQRVTGNDRLDVFYAEDVAAGANLPLANANTGTNAETLSTLPAAVGQAVLLSPVATGLCTVRSVTGVTAGTVDTPQLLNFANTGGHNQVAFTNAPAYAAQDRIALLGTLRWQRYRIDNGNLVLEQPLTGASAILVRNVIGLRVEYGVSAAGGSTLANWQDANDAGWGSLTAANIGQVRALRLGLVLRLPQREKADADGTCRASEAKPQLFGETIEPDVADWRCFRYRSSTLVVPLRNLVWGQVPA